MILCYNNAGKKSNKFDANPQIYILLWKQQPMKKKMLKDDKKNVVMSQNTMKITNMYEDL
jgi:hypothetical protein